MLIKKSFLFGCAVLFAALFSLAFTGCPSATDPTPSPVFEEKIDDTLANDAATLGLVGTTVDSSDAKIAAAEITSKGKIKITSKAAGKAELSVIDAGNKATIKVTVDSNGKIIIDEIAKYVKNNLKTVKITGFPANQTVHLGLTDVKDATSEAVATGNGKTYANGAAQIPLYDKDDKDWTGSGSYYVGIIFDTKIMVSKEKIEFNSTETKIAFSACEEIKIPELDVKTGTLTINNIPASYTHILVIGLSEPSFIGATLTGGSLPVGGAIKLLAATADKPIDFPATGEYAFMVLVDTAPFEMTGDNPPATAKTFMGSATFTDRAATVDWGMLVELPLSGN
jgi:hypothetical protein